MAAGVFLLLNIATAMHFPVWTDEVMQVDAGVNLYLGHGWTSTAWMSQSQHEFWAANNLLYPLLVYFWLKLFGFSAIIVRSLNYFLALVVTWLLVDTARRAGLLRSCWWLALLSVLLVCGQALTFVYRSGRADLTTMLIASCAFRFYLCSTNPWQRRVLLFLCGSLILPAGLQLLPYLALLTVIDYLLNRKVRVWDLATIGIGCGAGSLALMLFLIWKHSLRVFVSKTLGTADNMLGAGLQFVLIGDSKAVEKFYNILTALSPVNVLMSIVGDLSSVPLLLCLAVYAVFLWRSKASKPQSAAIYGLAAALLIPVGMLLAGHYRIYYAWMAATPIALAFTVALECLWQARRRALVVLGLAGALISVAIGLPSDLWRAANDPRSCNYSSVEGFVRAETQSGDWVYGDPLIYYAAKMGGVKFFSTTYAGGRDYPRMADDETARISVLIVPPEVVAAVTQKIGGRWTPVGTYSLPQAQLVVLRRIM